jgi:hypothetical protein
VTQTNNHPKKKKVKNKINLKTEERCQNLSSSSQWRRVYLQTLLEFLGSSTWLAGLVTLPSILEGS